ncbi:MAG: hypothetical protein VW989_13045, partial [Rhodobiaceae bacterium]
MDDRKTFPSCLRRVQAVTVLGLAAVLAVIMPFAMTPAIALACDAPAPVCAWKDRIVGIKTPNMIASGTILP